MDVYIYAGPLTRYFVGDWDRPEGPGLLAPGMRTEPRPPAADGTDEIRRQVLAWRRDMEAALEDLEAPLEWPEDPQAPWSVGKLGFGTFGALQLWAAYQEFPKRRRPEAVPDDWLLDPAIAALGEPDFESRFPHLLYGAALWLPVACEVFDDVDLDDDDTRFGSVPGLLAELEDLNQRTWKADPAEVERWRAKVPSPQADLATHARYAFSVLLAVAHRAADAGVPMVLEWPAEDEEFEDDEYDEEAED